MGRQLDLNMTSIPAYELDEYERNDPRPTFATVREIDFDLDKSKGELVFFFSRADFKVPVPDYRTDLKPLLEKIHNNSFTWDDTDQKEPKDPFDSRLSLRNRDWRFVIYRLSSSKKWQFCHNFAPFTLGYDAWDAEIYFEARRYDTDGSISRIEKKMPDMDGSMVAYFIADNRTSGNFTGHSLNIHVDLLYQGTTMRLPIVLDPDIRYPGGSGP